MRADLLMKSSRCGCSEILGKQFCVVTLCVVYFINVLAIIIVMKIIKVQYFNSHIGYFTGCRHSLLPSYTLCSIMNYIESILPYNGPKDMRRHMDKSETLPHMKRYALGGAFGAISVIISMNLSSI